ncbi:MAG: hypothetical protein HWD59_10305 [Coxiellaceae bacterium]|nr:MAG: hypothetical protein HWD59_10305 [Coxiellaceae bacterium]
MLDETTKLSKDQGKLIIKNYDLTEITSIMLLMANNQTISQSTSVHFENSKVSAITLLHIIGIMQKSDNKVKIDLTGCSFPELEIGEEIEKSYLESHRANTVMTTLELKGAWDTINITELRKLAGSIHQLIINTEIGFYKKNCC